MACYLQVRPTWSRRRSVHCWLVTRGTEGRQWRQGQSTQDLEEIKSLIDHPRISDYRIACYRFAITIMDHCFVYFLQIPQISMFVRVHWWLLLLLADKICFEFDLEILWNDRSADPRNYRFVWEGKGFEGFICSCHRLSLIKGVVCSNSRNKVSYRLLMGYF